MAKELPYFKFEPSMWDTGNIQMCSRESKGLFIDLCSLYWLRLGDLNIKFAIHKVCNGNANALDELIDEDIIRITDGEICIKFLDEQLSEFKSISKKRADAANERWKNANADANALQSKSKSNAIRGEDRRGDKMIEDKTRKDDVESKLYHIGFDSTNNIKNFYISKFQISYNDLCLKHGKSVVDEVLEEFGEFHNNATWQNENDLRKHFMSYLLKRPDKKEKVAEKRKEYDRSKFI